MRAVFLQFIEKPIHRLEPANRDRHKQQFPAGLRDFTILSNRPLDPAAPARDNDQHSQRLWCSGNTKASQALDEGSIPFRRSSKNSRPRRKRSAVFRSGPCLSFDFLVTFRRALCTIARHEFMLTKQQLARVEVGLFNREWRCERCAHRCS